MNENKNDPLQQIANELRAIKEMIIKNDPPQGMKCNYLASVELSADSPEDAARKAIAEHGVGNNTPAWVNVHYRDGEEFYEQNLYSVTLSYDFYV